MDLMKHMGLFFHKVGNSMYTINSNVLDIVTSQIML